MCEWGGAGERGAKAGCGADRAGRGGQGGTGFSLFVLIQTHRPGQRLPRWVDGGGVLAKRARAPCRASSAHGLWPGAERMRRGQQGIDQKEVGGVPLHLDACHSCAMREVGIDDDGSDFSEGYLHKRYRAYHAQVDGRIPPQRDFRYGLNELGGEECSLCGPDGVYKGSAPDPDTEHAESEEEEQEEGG